LYIFEYFMAFNVLLEALFVLDDIDQLRERKIVSSVIKSVKRI